MSGYSGRNRPAPNGDAQRVQRSYASQLREHEAMFHSYEHLQGLPRGDAALDMLRKVASMVKPVMRKRGWKVQILAEFLPPEQNLLGLNINRGFKICVRLRYHNNPDLFLPLEQVIDTMLHELSHNVWGDHDSNFHRLWDELRDEQETLIRKGFTGEGFLSEGKKLGGGRLPPPHEMRRLARAGAEKRQAQGKLTKGSGQKLGGKPLHLQGGDVRKTITDQILRRSTINKGCGSGRQDAVKLSDQAASNTFKTKADEDDANNRAIAQALYELMEEEEDRKLKGTFSETPTDGGLGWHPENGLYDPRLERPVSTTPSQRSGVSEEEQLEWALQESMGSTPDIPDQSNYKPLPDLPSSLDRTNSAPATHSTWKPSPVSATRPNFDSPISPIDVEERPRMKRKPVATQNMDSIANSTAPSTRPEPQKSPVVDISEPFDPNAGGSTSQLWTCEICTCINPLQFLACDACGTERPEPVGPGNTGLRSRPKPRTAYSVPASMHNETLGWVCTGCSAFMEHKWWTCSACGKMKESS